MKMFESEPMRYRPWTWLVMALLLLGTPLLAQAGMAPDMKSAGSETAMASVRQLFNESGLKTEKEMVLGMQEDLSADLFTNPLTLLFVGMPDSQVDVVNQLYSGTFDAEEFYNSIFQRMVKNYNADKAQKTLEFFRTALGRKLVELQQERSQQLLETLVGGRSGLDSFYRETGLEDLPSGKRLALVNRLVQSAPFMKHTFRVMESIIRVAAPLNAYYKSQPVDKMIATMRAELPGYLKTHRIGLVYLGYRTLELKEMEELVQFYESPAGRWYSTNVLDGSFDAQKLMNQKAKARLSDMMASLNLRIEDQELFQDIFPPGLRYLFTRKRDPFVPLVTLKKRKAEDVQDSLVPFDPQEGLNELPLIPYHHYLSLKEIEPTLYEDLEFYGTLFSNKEELALLKQEEYQEELENYRSLIQQALTVMEEGILTPLQVPLKSLTLVGMINSPDDGHIALVQTADTKGHTIKKGTLIGPNFGVVEDITEDQIVIVERTREFDGNITTTNDFLGFPQADGQ